MPIVLGTGNFGQVYQGEFVFQDGTIRSVAVKRLNGDCMIECVCCSLHSVLYELGMQEMKSHPLAKILFLKLIRFRQTS